jgi:hypothetical protein
MALIVQLAGNTVVFEMVWGVVTFTVPFAPLKEAQRAAKFWPACA